MEIWRGTPTRLVHVSLILLTPLKSYRAKAWMQRGIALIGEQCLFTNARIDGVRTIGPFNKAWLVVVPFDDGYNVPFPSTTTASSLD